MRPIKKAILCIFLLVAITLVAGMSFAQALNPNPPAQTVRLIFIHHSTGEVWLSDSHGRLGMALRDNNYFVSDANDGWGPNSLFGDPIGNHTDIGDWYMWFLGSMRDTFCSALYAESGQHCSYSRRAVNPGGQNTIVMFKSCFPNSNIDGKPSDPPLPKGQNNPLWGSGASSGFQTVSNVKGLYRDMLDYFATKQDKLFIVIISPPLVQSATTAARAANARAVADWLVNDWLTGYPHNNVAAFDFYNVLTSNGGSPNTNDLNSESGNHHRYLYLQIQHIQTVANNYASYGSGSTDSHPTASGDQKASEEFLPLLNIIYNRWKGTPPPEPATITVTAPPGRIDWQRGTTQMISWTAEGSQNSYVKIVLLKNGSLVNYIAAKTPNDGIYDWKIPATLAPADTYQIRVKTVDNKVSGDSEHFSIFKPSLIISAPAGGAHWTRASAQTISWTKKGTQSANVKVLLFRNDVKVRDMSTSTANDNSYDWTVPSSLHKAANFRVRVKTLDNLVSNDSGLFAID